MITITTPFYKFPVRRILNLDTVCGLVYGNKLSLLLASLDIIVEIDGVALLLLILLLLFNDALNATTDGNGAATKISRQTITEISNNKPNSSK